MLICLLALAAPRLLGEPQSAFTLLSDSGQTAVGKPEIDLQPRWEVRTPMATARSRLAAVVVGDNLFVIGGERENGQALDTVSAYDLRINEWRAFAPLPMPLANLAATVLDEQIYVAGGSYAGPTDEGTIHISDQFWRYDLEEGSWQELATLPAPLAGASLVAHQGSLFLIGGWDGETMRNEIWRYTPVAQGDGENGSWALDSRLETARGFAGATSVNDEIYLFGGFDGEDELDLAEAYSPDKGSWRQLPPLPTPRSGQSVVYDGLAIFVLGGGLDRAVGKPGPI
ncbi:MAG: hypothetical protein HC802_23460 [Caldilineaceae bacterium]|nr:hypothetical protein [Caldilineaceae bacterium]